MDHLVHASHVASPDELPRMVADAAADVRVARTPSSTSPTCSNGSSCRSCTASRPQPRQYPEALGIDSTVAGRAFQQMQPLTQSAGPVGGDRTRVGCRCSTAPNASASSGVTLPTAALDDEAGMRRLQRFASMIAELVMTKTLYGDSIVRARRTSPMTLAAEIQWSLLPPLTFVNRSITVAGGLEPAYEVAGDSARLRRRRRRSPGSRCSTAWGTAS